MNSQAAPAGLDALLRSARRRAGLTQEQLAGLSTVSVRAIRDLEQGRVQHPRKDTLRLLADAMRLGGARRAALELAVDGASMGSALREVYSAELAPPPTPLRPLSGRGPELRALGALLAARHERLLTVAGLPGVGKSRLAQEAAWRLHAEEKIPVLWVPMDEPGGAAAGAASRPQSALVNWVRTLVLHGGNVEELASVVGDKATLLVLDGSEVSPAVGPALMNLLHSCERLKILITTRLAHHTPGGRVLLLPPLPVPGPSEPVGALPGDSLVAEWPAVELMLSYVSHMRPNLLPTDSVTTAVAHICRALDGIPQALEAASSWLLLYSPEQMVEIARGTPLALIDEAFSPDPAAGPQLGALLAEVLRALPARHFALLKGLAALSGPWTVQAAARAAGVTMTDAARDVHALLVQGLIRQLPGEGVLDEARFTVLHLITHLVGEGSPYRPVVDTPVLAGATALPVL